MAFTTTTTVDPSSMTEMDRAALAEADRAKLLSPGGISETHQATTEELHQRIQALEARQVNGDVSSIRDLQALVKWIFDNNYRNADIPAIIAAYEFHLAGSEVDPKTVRG